MEPEMLEAFERFIYTPSFIVCAPEMWYGESVLITDDFYTVVSYLDSFETEGLETPIVIHGVLLPARMIQQNLSECTNLFIITFPDTYDTSLLYNEINVMLDGKGIVLEAKINEITFKNVEKRMLEHITEVVEEEIEKDNLDIEDVFLFAGYKPRTIIGVDEGTVDENKLEKAKQISEIAQEFKDSVEDIHFNGQVY